MEDGAFEEKVILNLLQHLTDSLKQLRLLVKYPGINIRNCLFMAVMDVLDKEILMEMTHSLLEVKNLGILST